MTQEQARVAAPFSYFSGLAVGLIIWQLSGGILNASEGEDNPWPYCAGCTDESMDPIETQAGISCAWDVDSMVEPNSGDCYWSEELETCIPVACGPQLTVEINQVGCPGLDGWEVVSTFGEDTSKQELPPMTDGVGIRHYFYVECGETISYSLAFKAKSSGAVVDTMTVTGDLVCTDCCTCIQ